MRTSTGSDQYDIRTSTAVGTVTVRGRTSTTPDQYGPELRMTALE